MSSYTDDSVLTVEEAAVYLRVSPATVYKHIGMTPACPERIPSVALGRRRVIVFWQLRQWMAQQAGVSLPQKPAALQH